MTDIITLFNQWQIENNKPVVYSANPYLGPIFTKMMFGETPTDEEVLAHFDKVNKGFESKEPSKSIEDVIDRLEKELNISQEEAEEFNKLFEELRKELNEGKK